MEQTPRQEQFKEQQTRRQPEKLGTPLHEIYESILKQRRYRAYEGYDDDDHNDDDPDCYCE